MLATEGVRNVQETFKSSMTLATSRTRDSSSGTHTTAPCVSALKTSMTPAANVYEAKLNTREVDFMNIVRVKAAELVLKARCSRTTPLGLPVEPLV